MCVLCAWSCGWPGSSQPGWPAEAEEAAEEAPEEAPEEAAEEAAKQAAEQAAEASLATETVLLLSSDSGSD